MKDLSRFLIKQPGPGPGTVDGEGICLRPHNQSSAPHLRQCLVIRRSRHIAFAHR